MGYPQTVVRALPLVPVSTSNRVYYAGPRMNCGSPAVAYGGWWQNLLHPKRAQANQDAQVQAQDNDYAMAQAQLAAAEASSQQRMILAAGAGLLALGGLALYLRKRRKKNPRRNGRRR